MVTVLQENLYKAIKQVKHTPIHDLPVINHVRIKYNLESGWLDVTALNPDDLTPVTVHCACRADSGEALDICAPLVKEYINYPNGNRVGHKRKGYPLLDWLSVCGLDILNLDLDARTQTLIITSERTRAEFKCLDSMEFPQ